MSRYGQRTRLTNLAADSQIANWLGNKLPVISASYLVVAGGGGNAVGQGGSREAGSGAGGMKSSSLNVYAGNTYTITVGQGGSGQTNGTSSSISGSSITTISTSGGGAGGNNDLAPAGVGKDGGSGGGGWYQNGGGLGVLGEGYDGSTGYLTSPYGGAGGGAGGAGGRGTAVGVGRADSITGSSVTYATGGKSNDYPSTTYNANGAANSGDGASGVGNGGSGVVIISSSSLASATTGSPTLTTNGSNYVYKFTGNGSITY